MKVIVIDAIGLHAGFLGCYGNEWIATPTFDSLACEGVVFENHIANCPLLTSTTQGDTMGEPAASTNLLALAKERGWQVQRVATTLAKFGDEIGAAVEQWGDHDAILWVDGPSLVPPWKVRAKVLGAYFDDKHELEPWPDPPRRTSKPMELDDWTRLRDTYAGVVTYFDARLGEIIQTIMRQGWGGETLVCVTARSGLPLGEHGQIGAADGPLHEERVHVPLILNLPGEEYAATRIQSLTQTVDLAPSLAALIFGEKLDGSGLSFVPLMSKETDAVREYAFSFVEHEAYLRNEDWALSLSTSGEGTVSRLYRKPEDRWEANDLRQKELDRAEEMEKFVGELLGGEESRGC